MNMRVNPHIVAMGLALAAPSLEGLSMALRDRSTWPPDFEWDFSSCDNCAMGLANSLWGIISEDAGPIGDMASAFGIPWTDASNLFYSAEWLKPVPRRFLGVKIGSRAVRFSEVTPEMVADAIDAYLLAE